MRKKIWSILYAFLVILLIWALAAFQLQSVILPSPIETGKILIENFVPKLLPQLVDSYGRLLLAIFWSIMIGSILGLATGLNDRINQLIMPVINFLYSVPRVTFLPLFLIFFGLNDCAKIALMTAVSVFYFIIPIHDRVRNIPENYRIISKTLSFNSLQWLWHVVIPACLPDFFTAIKLTIGSSMATLFLAENISGSSGIGYYIMNAWSFSNYPAMYAGIVLVALAGVIVFVMLELVEKVLTPWLQGGKK